MNVMLRTAVLLSLALLAGCSSIQPWVMPYERGYLADPIMDPDRDRLVSSHRRHVFDVREGASGAAGTSGGGCGCN
ncbi:MAG: DUF4266 domain-containing protein [Ectothiorhodospiraceae bacterium]|nr:DUF4266 domain-containing protein [Ectothiorhodospiraceae bacterium]MCH8504992.1 DUF4266 domain-containing protein [Ectothiorhodospiraceae bacterium]